MNTIARPGLISSEVGVGRRLYSVLSAATLPAWLLLFFLGAMPAGAQCTLLSATTWSSGASGNWSIGGNWSSGSSPSATTNTCITDGSSAVTLNTNGAAANLQLGSGNTLDVLDSNGTGISLNVTGTIANSGNLNFSWTGMGTGSGNTVSVGTLMNNNGGSVLMNGSGDFLNAGSVTNSGLIDLTTGMPSYTYYSETLNVANNFTNNSGGMLVFDANSVYNFVNVAGNFTNSSGGQVVMFGEEDYLTVGTTSNVFTNNGLVIMGGGLETLTVNGDFNNSSIVLLTGYGDMLVASGTFTNDGTLTLNQAIPSTTLAGNSLGAQTLINNGTITLSNGQQFIGTTANLTNNGTITLDSTTNASQVSAAGTFTNSLAANVYMNGINDILYSNDIENYGSITLNNANQQVFVGPGGPASPAYPFDNYGSLTFAGSTAAGPGSNNGLVYVTGSFTNGGTVTMSGSNDVLQAYSFTNSGIITLNGINEGIEGNQSTGDFTNTSTGTLILDNTTPSSSCTLPAGTTCGNYVVVPGAFTNNGMVTMSGNGDELAASAINNSSTISISGSQETVYVSGGGQFTNSGTLGFSSTSNGSQVYVSGEFTNQTGGTVSMIGTDDTLTTTGVGYFVNNGSVLVGPTETLNASGYGYNNSGTTTVVGTLNTPSYQQLNGTTTVWTSGNLNATLNYMQTGGTTSVLSGGMLTTGDFEANGGTVNIAAGGNINATTYNVNHSTTIVNGLLDPTSVTLGTAANLQGTGTIIGNVTNSGGTITPGAPGTPGMLTINGDYTQGADGILDIDLAGTGAGQYSLLNISGEASLDGTLDLIATNGFDPTVGDDFNFLMADSESGDFSDVILTGWSCPVGAVCSESFSDDMFSLDITPATPTPEPSTFLMLAAGLGTLGAFWRSKRLHAR